MASVVGVEHNSKMKAFLFTTDKQREKAYAGSLCGYA